MRLHQPMLLVLFGDLFAVASSLRPLLSANKRPFVTNQRYAHIMTPPVVDIYPYSSNHEIATKFPNSHKVIHILRHAEGTHNVNNDYRSDANLDARLTEHGIQQCDELAQSCHVAPSVIITSTMTRCIQTALRSFPNSTTFVAHESLRETVNFVCDKRRSITEIAKEYPMVDFSQVFDEEDPIWNAYEQRLGDIDTWTQHRESGDLVNVAARGRTFFQFLRSFPHDEVVVCTHSAFLRCVLNWGYGVPMKPPQLLGVEEEDHPVVRYCGDEDWEEQMRTSFQNCELRSMIVVFPSN